VGRRIHADTVAAELLPADKARWIEERRAAGRRVAMVGDGINDAPALAQADAGIALGGMGADLAAEAGNLIILGDPLRVLPELVRLSRQTVAVIRQNIIGFAFGLNAVAMLSATFGILGPVAAAILHQAGSLLVLLNSMRLLAFGDWAELPPVRQIRRLGAGIARLDDQVDLESAWQWIWGRRRTILGLTAGSVLLALGTSGWRAIGPGEVGVLRRFGRYQDTLGPGLHLRWPYPIESIDAVASELIRSLEIGFRAARMADAEFLSWEAGHGRLAGDLVEDEALLLTGDGRYVELAATLQYAIDREDPEALRRFVLGVDRPETAIRPLAEAVVREVVGRRELLDLLTQGRRPAEEAAAALLEARLRAYQFGIAVRRIAFQDIHPPLAVLDAYRDVSRATSDRYRRINEASTHRDVVLAEAKGKAQAELQAAEASRSRQLALAGGAADRFSALVEARRYAPELTDFRLFAQLVGEALSGKSKLVVDDPPGHPRHLVVPNAEGLFGGLPPSVLPRGAK
jgi:Cu+-exporting ATPase